MGRSSLSRVYLVDPDKCFFCGEPLPCNCDTGQGEPKPNARPYAYHTDFLTPAEATDYFNRIMEMQSSLGPADTYGRMKQSKLDCGTAYSGYRQSLWIGPEINPGKSEARRCTRGPETREWPSVIAEVKERVEAKTGEKFNSCLVNLYSTGSGGIGHHRDQDDESDWTRSIASVSLGAERKFNIYDIPDGTRLKAEGVKSKLISSAVLHDGSLCIMPAGFQQKYEHEIPVEKKITEPRINLTFRWIADWQKKTEGGPMKSKPITPDGHDFFEALSALQKSVRRNKEGDALYWAYQLSQFNPKALWNRLKVFASEEVGLASPETVLLVRALYDNWQDIAEKDSGERGLFIAHAVVALCRAKKSSLAVNAACIMTVLPKREIPDYALDRHTHRGKTLGRGWDHFFDEGAHRENLDETIPDIYMEHVRKHIEKINGTIHKAKKDK